MKYSLSLIGVLLLFACTNSNHKESSKQMDLNKFDLQGHRGARGLKPENTIPAFLEALKYDVNTLELDVVISADSQIVLSHEPWFSHSICTKPNGSSISEIEEKKLSLYQMSYDTIRTYDCGHIGNIRFPEQVKINVFKPTLAMVTTAVKTHFKINNSPQVAYNIETKTTPKGDNIYHPTPDVFVDLLYKELKRLDILEITTIQSFDVRTLQVLHKLDSTVTTALLIDENQTNFEANLSELGFTPDIYSCYYELVNEKLVEKCHKRNIKIIPWTINDETEMKRLIELGIDGLITDYPNRGRVVLDEF